MLHEPNDVNQRRARARSSTGPSARSSRVADDVVRCRAVEGPQGRDEDVEEAVVLEAVVAGVPQRPVQTGRALERRLAVQGRVDPRGESGRGGKGGLRARRCGTSAAALPRPPRRRRRATGGSARSAAARRRPAASGSSEPASRAAYTAATTRWALPARSSRSRKRDLEAGQIEPELAAEPGGALDLPGAAGDHDRERAAEAADQRQVGVRQHERADQAGAVVGVAGAVRRGRIVEWRVAGREDRGVVDQAGPGGIEFR